MTSPTNGGGTTQNCALLYNKLRCNIKHITCDFLPRVLLYMKRNNLLAKIYKLENSDPYASLQGGHTRFSHLR